LWFVTRSINQEMLAGGRVDGGSVRYGTECDCILSGWQERLP
jgi:hypothetical protein